MRHALLLFAGLLVLRPHAAPAESRWWEAGGGEDDIKMSVRLESIPSGAEVCTTPLTSYDEPVTIGRTPMEVPIGLKWERLYKKTIWKALHVSSPGAVCQHDYSREDGSHSLFLNVTLRQPGYEDTNVVVHLGTLLKSEVVWTNLQPPAYPRIVRATLTPAGGARSAAGRQSLRTVMIASGSGDNRVETGAVRVFANVPRASVFVNGEFVGSAPVRVILDAAPHFIEVQSPGYRSGLKNVVVSAGPDSTLRFDLEPE